MLQTNYDCVILRNGAILKMDVATSVGKFREIYLGT